MKPIRVIHLVDAAGGSKYLWGKEQAILSLIDVQRASGVISPMLITFSSCLLATLAAKRGVETRLLESRHRMFPIASFYRLWCELRTYPQPVILHTHEYKANILGRLVKTLTNCRVALVSTCHGWIEESLRLRLYNILDRRSSALSDIVTTPDPAMLSRLARSTSAVSVPNRIPLHAVPTQAERMAAKRRFGWSDNQKVVGMLGRLSEEKGVRDFQTAAHLSKETDIVWAIAGAGPMENALRTDARIAFVDYLRPASDYLKALDVFVQPSRMEAASLVLLEAARVQLPIIATMVGATPRIVRDRKEALLVPPRDPLLLAQTVSRVLNDPDLAIELSTNARARFERHFQIDATHRAYRHLYNLALKKKE